MERCEQSRTHTAAIAEKLPDRVPFIDVSAPDMITAEDTVKRFSRLWCGKQGKVSGDFSGCLTFIILHLQSVRPPLRIHSHTGLKVGKQQFLLPLVWKGISDKLSLRSLVR